MADKVWRRSQSRHKAGNTADKVWRRGLSGLKADPWPTHGGHMANKVWRRGQSGLKANTGAGIQRTHGGQSLEKRPSRTQGGRMADNIWTRGQNGLTADTWQTFLRENPAADCSGNYTSIDPNQFFKHRVRLQRPNLEATALPHSRPRADKVQRQDFSAHMVDKRQGKQMADKVWRHSQSGHKAGHRPRHGFGRHKDGRKADTWRTKFGDAAGRGHPGLKADTGQTQGGHMADAWLKSVIWRTHGGKGLEARKADSSRTQGTRRTHGEHKADKLWGRGQGISRPVFFLRENPTVNCLGEKKNGLLSISKGKSSHSNLGGSQVV